MVFESAVREIHAQSLVPDEQTEGLLRKLDRRARIVLGLFSRQDEITANDVARVLGLSARQSREVMNEWLEAGWLEVSDAARKTRKYRLSAVYRLNNGGFTYNSPHKVSLPCGLFDSIRSNHEGTTIN